MSQSNQYLVNIVKQQKAGKASGIYSVCSANEFVLDACIRNAVETGSHLLIESTCNQVNQFGGYTGQTPADFHRALRELAAKLGLPEEQLILGGDHLGPFPWKSEDSADAMAKSVQMVKEYVAAGYQKIHLDASMNCASDQKGPISKETSAERAALLCEAAEKTAVEQQVKTLPVYVIGTEVPTPGGQVEKNESVAVTVTDDIQETLAVTKRAFEKKNLQGAWERVIALVVQPGVEFGDNEIISYQREKAAGIKRFIESFPGIVYEAHSTDYQRSDKLKELVEDHFAILKVGPALTFAFREAIFALELIEKELADTRPGMSLSQLSRVMNAAMDSEPKNWKAYFSGSEEEVRLARIYSFSDRIRYYWNVPEVNQSVNELITNLETISIPLTLVSQYLPIQYAHIREGKISATPRKLIRDHILDVVRLYESACG